MLLPGQFLAYGSARQPSQPSHTLGVHLSNGVKRSLCVFPQEPRSRLVQNRPQWLKRQHSGAVEAVIGHGARSSLNGGSHSFEHLGEGTRQALAGVNVSLCRALDHMMSGLKRDPPRPDSFRLFSRRHRLELVKRRHFHRFARTAIVAFRAH